MGKIKVRDEVKITVTKKKDEKKDAEKK